MAVDYLFESKHPGGTYSAILVNQDSAEQLFAYCASLGIPNLVEPTEYHCTVIYSGRACPDVATEDFGLECQAIPTGFRVLGSEKPVLVLELYCPNAVRLHELFMEKYGATHDYPEYIPHVTVAKDFEGEIPKDIPEIEIVFDRKTVEELE